MLEDMCRNIIICKRNFDSIIIVGMTTYRHVSNIRRIKSQHLKDSRTVLQLSLPNPLKPDVKSRMEMKLEQRGQAMLQLHLSHRQLCCLLRCVLY